MARLAMSRDRFDELVEKRQQLRDQLTSVESELREEAMSFVKATTVVAPVKKTRRVNTTAATTTDNTTTNDGGDRQPSLKEIVQDILGNKSHGMELKEIVNVVSDMIKNGAYRSRAKKITPVVSQALFALKQEHLVAVEKSTADDGRSRHIYILNTAKP